MHCLKLKLSLSCLLSLFSSLKILFSRSSLPWRSFSTKELFANILKSKKSQKGRPSRALCFWKLLQGRIFIFIFFKRPFWGLKRFKSYQIHEHNLIILHKYLICFKYIRIPLKLLVEEGNLRTEAKIHKNYFVTLRRLHSHSPMLAQMFALRGMIKPL